MWQPIARNASGLVHNAGLLKGLNNIKPRKLFDLTRYGVARLETYEGEQGNPCTMTEEISRKRRP
jgi:hypothetical protein